MKKRIIPLLLALLLIVTAAAFSIQAADETVRTPEQIMADAAALEGTFPTSGNYTADCPVCGTGKTWKPFTAAVGAKATDGDHYYIPKDFSDQWQAFTLENAKTVCLHTNGKNYTTPNRFAYSGGGSILNIMGSGSITVTGSKEIIRAYKATINLYDTTLVRTDAADESTAGVNVFSSTAAINMYNADLLVSTGNAVTSVGNLSISGGSVTGGGVNITGGTVKLSGATRISGEGLVLPAGTRVDLSGGLTEGAQIKLSAEGVFTSVGMAAYAKYFTPANADNMIFTGDDGTLSCVPEGAVLVSADGSITVADDILAQWNTGNYAYIKLYVDEAFADLGGAQVYVDLNGNDLTVGGAGTLYAFDSANDTYDAAACGSITNNGTVEIATDVAAPNGRRYIALTDDTTTMHRLDMQVQAVTLRTGAAGLYYKAVYYCDALLSNEVEDYGVVLSVDNMPGSDFLNEAGDINRHTVSKAPFASGVTATSGSVFGIMKTGREATENARNGEMEIYANAYVKLTANDLIVVGDEKNAGKTSTDEGFTGTAWSLHEVLDAIDGNYYNYSGSDRQRIDQFRRDWNGSGMGDWRFLHVGDGVDNSDLVFDANTSDAFCPVCREKVTWTALSGAAMTVLDNGTHYYLANDVTYTGKETAIVRAPGARGHEACLHLNGHNLTALYTKAIFGNTGVLNVMGNGYVTGYATSTNFGTAVQANNTVATSAINLYGGTYRRSDDSNKNAAAITVWTVGGNIYIYKGATVDGKGGTAVYMANASYTQGANAKIGLYGCTIENGSVLTAGPDLSKGNTTTLEILDAAMEALKVGYNSTIFVGGKTVIGKLELAEDTKITADGLEQGSSITVYSDGFITEASSCAKDYLDYFKPRSPAYKITVRNDALYCAKDYVSDLVFTQGATALCPVCEKEVTWTALVAGDAGVALNNGDHYYLESDQTYTGSGNSFVSAPGSGTMTACLHLNGHDLTATKTRAIYGSAGILNVMGSGNVSGVAGSTAGVGSAIQINTGGVNGAVNLYSGTYQQAEGAGNDEYTLNIADNGGKINIYVDASVKGNISGNAIRMGTSNLVNTAVGIYGGQIDGNVVTGGANQSKGKVNSLILDNAKVNGTIDVDGVNTVTVRHATVIQLLELDQQNTLLTMDRLTDGASITVDTNGKFTVAHSDAGTYKNYFSPKNKAATISMENNELYYAVNYVSGLTVTDGQGYCPVCEKTVAWEKLETADSAVTLASGQHLYLTGDLTYEGTTSFLAGPSSNNVACLHLNGHNITATRSHAIYSSGGVFNVMGSGIVTGYTGNAIYGGAVTANTITKTTAINLYGGTYKKTADSAANARVVAFRSNGGKINIYAGATVDAGGGNAIYISTSNLRDSVLGIYGATVKGGIYSAGANPAKGFSTTISLEDATVTSTMLLEGDNDVTIEGKAVIGKLVIPQGLLVNFIDMKAGSSIKVSADGAFTAAFDEAENFLQYFSAADEGDWVIVRDHALCQSVRGQITAATDEDKTILDTVYAGKEALHGEMHDHTNTGPKADGKNSLAEWIAEMERLDMDFATIVDHKQSIHMYHENWDDTVFVGGSEPQAIITDSKASQKVIHYNMIFDNPADLEAIVQEFAEFNYVAASDGNGGTFGYPNFTTARFTQLAQAIYEKGGLLVHVHPKYDKYLVSDDPLDYWFSDYTGLEITTGSGGNMMTKNNEEAYQTWVDLLELGKKIWATSGSDQHALPNTSALTTLYSAEHSASAYLESMRSGNFAPGWVGIRMNVNGTAMGGQTDFSGRRLQFSVGDIYNSTETDAYGTAPAYVEGHTYRVELYDDGGLLMESIIDPTQMNYFAVDCDETAKFYRVVVWDDTVGTRIGVGNPIWND